MLSEPFAEPSEPRPASGSSPLPNSLRVLSTSGRTGGRRCRFEPVDVAAYVGEMAAELGALATAAGHQSIAELLQRVSEEAKRQSRT